MTAEEYARAQVLMCDDHLACRGCPVASLAIRKHHKNCMITRMKFPKECVEAVERWWNENKHRFQETEVKK